MIFTLLIATSVTLLILSVRHGYHRAVRTAWQQAHWWEKAILIAAFLPIPGPFDEIAAILVVRRIAKRV